MCVFLHLKSFKYHPHDHFFMNPSMLPQLFPVFFRLRVHVFPLRPHRRLTSLIHMVISHHVLFFFSLYFVFSSPAFMLTQAGRHAGGRSHEGGGGEGGGRERYHTT